jgi:hypothetical protein
MRHLLVSALALTLSCAATQKKNCTDVDLAQLEAAYVIEVLAACDAYRVPEDCPDYPSIRDKYDVRREEYIQCQ